MAPPAGQAGVQVSRLKFLMHEYPADRAGAGIQVLVATPNSKVHVPVMQVEGYIAYSMRKVKANLGANLHPNKHHSTQERIV